MGILSTNQQSRANLCSPFSSFKVPMMMVGNPRLSTIQVLHGEFALATKGSERLLKMCDYQWIYIGWSLRRNEAGEGRCMVSWLTLVRKYPKKVDIPDAEFARHFSRDDGFCTRCAKCSFDPVNRETRITHSSHEYSNLIIR